MFKIWYQHPAYGDQWFEWASYANLATAQWWIPVLFEEYSYIETFRIQDVTTGDVFTFENPSS